MPSGSDAPKSSISDYDKFVAPSLNRVDVGGAGALSSHSFPAEPDPNTGVSTFTSRKEKQAVQKLLANDSSNPITLSAIGIGLLSLATMLGVRLQRGLQPATVLASSGGLGPVMPMNTASALGDNAMEMKTQVPMHNSNPSRVGWGQLSSQNSHPLTVCSAGVVEGLTAVAVGGGLAVLLSEDNRDIDDKTEVEKYFNGEEGFGRWNKIYSETDDVNSVQKEIRDGHAQTIDKVLSWAEADGRSVCDLGCGVGSLAIPLAQKGATVSASDISNAMAKEASKRAAAAGITSATFDTSDMENVSGEYDTVSCIDVMIHYPTDKMVGLVDKLCSLSKDKIYVSFAPKTPQLAVLKKVGSLFPGPSKATRAYLHKEEDVVAALEKNGFKVDRQHLTSQNFYFSLLLEAQRMPAKA
jgi:magnesium-protoporphyrin O-methyltransferase